MKASNKRSSPERTPVGARHLHFQRRNKQHPSANFQAHYANEYRAHGRLKSMEFCGPEAVDDETFAADCRSPLKPGRKVLPRYKIIYSGGATFIKF